MSALKKNWRELPDIRPVFSALTYTIRHYWSVSLAHGKTNTVYPASEKVPALHP